MGKCVFCKNFSATLHKFPQDEALCKQWVKLIGLEGWKPKDSSLLCSDHFPEVSFVVHYSNRKRLKPGIVSTILMKKAKFKKQGNALLEKNYRNTLIDTSTAVPMFKLCL
ncbi:THAP domain-containing protein 3-like [Bombus vancouverensis nearcticus]|uniref:THAP domain-containing protein 3-like n=1 Tax=Bombus vancouverensis nearcticus TaxID=2705178 RepID=UPI00402BF1E7